MQTGLPEPHENDNIVEVRLIPPGIRFTDHETERRCRSLERIAVAADQEAEPSLESDEPLFKRSVPSPVVVAFDETGCNHDQLPAVVVDGLASTLFDMVGVSLEVENLAYKTENRLTKEPQCRSVFAAVEQNWCSVDSITQRALLETHSLLFGPCARMNGTRFIAGVLMFYDSTLNQKAECRAMLEKARYFAELALAVDSGRAVVCDPPWFDSFRRAPAITELPYELQDGLVSIEYATHSYLTRLSHSTRFSPGRDEFIAEAHAVASLLIETLHSHVRNSNRQEPLVSEVLQLAHRLVPAHRAGIVPEIPTSSRSKVRRRLELARELSPIPTQDARARASLEALTICVHAFRAGLRPRGNHTFAGAFRAATQADAVDRVRAVVKALGHQWGKFTESERAAKSYKRKKKPKKQGRFNHRRKPDNDTALDPTGSG